MNWPKLEPIDIEVPEKRIRIILVNTTEWADNIFERYSTIQKLNRFVAYAMRIWNNMTFKEKSSGELTVQEINEARNLIIKLVQEGAFGVESKALRKGTWMSCKSKIICFNPFIGDDGIIRVGGRLSKANITNDQKYPIFLPRSHHVPKLIIRDTHIKYYHAGIQTTLYLVRGKYWPMDGKSTTRRIIHTCVRCAKLRPVPFEYKMGNLPRDRFTIARPFSNVGLDLCGLFLIKEKRYRNKKRIVLLKEHVKFVVVLNTICYYIVLHRGRIIYL